MRAFWKVIAWVAFDLATWAQPAAGPVDSVDPYIGSIGRLLTATPPNVQLPYGMVRVAPWVTPGVKDRYLAERIYGFPAGGSVILPLTGQVEGDPAKAASGYDHDLEAATPYHYAVKLETYDVDVEYSTTRRGVYYRFRFPRDADARVLIRRQTSGGIQVSPPDAVSGYEDAPWTPRTYFYAKFSQPFASRQEWPGVGVAVGFRPAGREPVEAKVGVSYISSEQARRNIEEEIPDWDFERVKRQARETWNTALARIRVRGGTRQQRRIFYTALYRVMGRPNNVTESGSYYSGADGKVHPAEGRDFYTGRRVWGSYRSLHPLQSLLDPDRIAGYVRSYIRYYEQSGWLQGAYKPGMIGHHIGAVIADAYMRGLRDFDAGKAYAGMKTNVMEATRIPWRRGPATELDQVYLEKGFFPALAPGAKEWVKEVDRFERRQAVSVTLEAAYDDWCAAQMAKALGKPADYETLIKRALNYRNVFDARTGFMAPKTTDGKFIPGFDPIWSGGQGGRDYFTESNGWIYAFAVQHDLAGLIGLMGGREKFIEKLDALFTTQYRGHREGLKFAFLGQFPDSTGLIGQYAHGNEPSHHIAYLYNYAGAPWMTARRVRQIMDVWYQDTPLGICGDEDDGEMSSWYVLSALGFYPVCPGRPVWDLGSPLFEEAHITLANGKVFTIRARNVSAGNKYIQRAELNGRPLERPWFAHREMAGGGTLVLEMGPRPNKAWGSAPGAAPPSLSQE